VPEGPLGWLHHSRCLVRELIETRDEKRLLRPQRRVAGYKFLIIDELGFVPFSQTGAGLIFEVFSRR
jgi:DNA replication protein DnaC